MATLANLYLAIGAEIGDRFNAEVPQPRLLQLINRAIKDLARDTNCLWDTATISGLYDIKILDYAQLASDDTVITLKTSDDSASVTYTENGVGGGTAWASITSNSATATSLATALNGHANVMAYAVNEHVYLLTKYVRAEESADITITTLSSSSDASDLSITSGAAKFKLPSIITNYRKIQNVYIAGGDVFHVPYARQHYDTALTISTGLTASFYNIVPESGTYQMYFKHKGANLSPASVITMDYLVHPSALSASTESPPGILADFDDAVISRTMYYYMKSTANYQAMILQKQMADDAMKDVRHELRTQGEVQSISHFQKWY